MITWHPYTWVLNSLGGHKKSYTALWYESEWLEVQIGRRSYIGSALRVVPEMVFSDGIASQMDFPTLEQHLKGNICGKPYDELGRESMGGCLRPLALPCGQQTSKKNMDIRQRNIQFRLNRQKKQRWMFKSALRRTCAYHKICFFVKCIERGPKLILILGVMNI